MGIGISFMTSCCNKNNKNQELIDIDINRISNNMPNINYLKTPIRVIIIIIIIRLIYKYYKKKKSVL